MIDFEPNTTLEQDVQDDDDDHAVFDHVLDNLLKLRVDHPLRLVIPATFPYMEMSAFLIFTDDDFKAMRYNDPTIPTGSAMRTLPLLPGAANLFIQVREFIRHKCVLSHNNFPSNPTWLGTTHIEWKYFLARPDLPSPMVPAMKWSLPSVRGPPDAVSPPTNSTQNSFGFGNHSDTAQVVSTRKIPRIEYSTEDSPKSKVLEVDDNNSASVRDSNVLLPITIGQVLTESNNYC